MSGYHLAILVLLTFLTGLGVALWNARPVPLREDDRLTPGQGLLFFCICMAACIGIGMAVGWPQ